MEKSYLELENVTFAYGSRPILRNVSMRFGAGQVVATRHHEQRAPKAEKPFSYRSTIHHFSNFLIPYNSTSNSKSSPGFQSSSTPTATSGVSSTSPSSFTSMRSTANSPARRGSLM